MANIYQELLQLKENNKKLLASLINPHKINMDLLSVLDEKINQLPATHIFLGGISSNGTHLDELITKIKSNCDLSIVLFPENPSNISKETTRIFFLTLHLGRN